MYGKTLISSRKHPRDALFVTEKREHSMVAEHIRVLFKLSEALEQEPRGSEEACKLRDQAERLFRQRAPYAEELGREETYESRISVRLVSNNLTTAELSSFCKLL